MSSVQIGSGFGGDINGSSGSSGGGVPIFKIISLHWYNCFNL